MKKFFYFILIFIFLIITGKAEAKIGLCPYRIVHDPQGVYYGGTIAAPVLRDIYDNVLPYLGIEKN